MNVCMSVCMHKHARLGGGGGGEGGSVGMLPQLCDCF